MGITLNNVSYSYKGKFQTVKAVDGVKYIVEGNTHIIHPPL